MSWFSTLRIRTLPAAASPVLLGSAIAANLGGFELYPALAALAGALLLQIGTNLANDYYDHVKGADTPDRAGPARASASGTIPPLNVRNAAFAALGAALLVGVYLVTVGGWPIVAIGLAGIISAWAYTGGPFPLAYNGLGDLFAFAFFGPIAVAGTTYVQTGTWEADAIIWGCAAGFLTTAILVVNNLRDRPTDEVANKRTLVVRFGDRFGQWEWATLLSLAFMLPFIYGGWLLLPLAATIVALPPAGRMFGALEPRAALNPALGGTARVLLVFCLLAALGFLLEAR